MLPSTNQQGYVPGSRQRQRQPHQLQGDGLEPPLEPFPYAPHDSTYHNNNNDINNNININSVIFKSSSSSRFSKWLALMALSVVAWCATLGSARHHPMDRAERWALSATTLATVGSLLGVACFLWARGVFAGQLPEVILVGMIVVVWAGALPVLMDPAKDIAVSFSDSLNANLYFGSWLSFACALVLAHDLLQERYGYNVVDGILSSSMILTANGESGGGSGGGGKWVGLLVTSLIAMCSSLRTFHAFQCQTSVMSLAPTCRQTKFAIAASVVSTLISMLILFLLMKIMVVVGVNGSDDVDAPPGVTSTTATATDTMRRRRTIVQRYSSVLMVVLWSFGLGYTTFGDGPGKNIGNLYFSTWTSFLLSVLLVADSFFWFSNSSSSAKPHHDDSMEPYPSLSHEQEMSEDIAAMYVHDDGNDDVRGDELFLHQTIATTTKAAASRKNTTTSSHTNLYHAAEDDNETFDDAQL
jgi:hypothetical protein